MSWARPFDDPIPTPKSKTLATLKHAAACIMALPKTEAATAEWQAAIESLKCAISTASPRIRPPSLPCFG